MKSFNLNNMKVNLDYFNNNIYQYCTYLGCILTLLSVSCVKVSKSYKVVLPADHKNVFAVEGEAIESRNVTIGTIPASTIQQIANDFRDSISNKELSDNKEQKSPSSPFLSGQMHTEIEKLTSSICIKDASIRPSGTSIIGLDIRVVACGLKADIHKPRLIIEFSELSKDRSITVAVKRMKIKDSFNQKELTIGLKVQVNREGRLEITGDKRITGLESLADVDNYEIDASLLK